MFYGAAEFSRDVDFAILADAENLIRLQSALDELEAHLIAIPAFEARHLHHGLIVHFRCQATGVEGLRVDVMTVMREVDPFPALWERRTVIVIDGIEANLLSLPDLVKAKKTQRAKDWPMVQRLIEAHWFQNRSNPTPARVDFWLRECRTPGILLDMAALFTKEATELQSIRPLLTAALQKNADTVEQTLEHERQAEITADKVYWAPLRQELERLRRSR